MKRAIAFTGVMRLVLALADCPEANMETKPLETHARLFISVSEEPYEVNQPVTASVTGVSDTDVVFYEWKRGSSIKGPFVVIDGETDAAYTCVGEDYGKYLIVTAFVSRTGYSGEARSEPFGPILADTSNVYTISFETNGGSSIDPVEVFGGSSLERPQNPVKSGLAFDVWYADQSLTTPFNFSSPVTGNATIYAGWAKTKIIFDDLAAFTETSSESAPLGDKVINDFQRGGTTGPTYALSTERDHTTGSGKSFKWANWTAAGLQQRVKFDKMFTSEDVGKTFSISLWVYSASAVNVKLGAFSLSGVSPATSNPTTPIADSGPIPITANTWSQVVWNGYTHTSENVTNMITQIGIEQVTPGPPAATFYIDDITIKETN
jgi:uncharacterized repeat protein (TIGR02543 family)